MKRILSVTLMTTAVGAVIVATFIGCGSGSTSTNSSFSGTSCTGSGCSSASTYSFTGGDTETLVPASTYALSLYAGQTIYNPTSVVVNLQVTGDGNSPDVYFGQLIVAFTDGSVVHRGTFVNGTSESTWNHFTNNVSTLTTNASGNPVYRFFFEDAAGALVLVLSGSGATDTTTTLSGTLSGTLYFSNFNSAAPNPLYQGGYDENGNYYPPGDVFCWMIDAGPYNCRNFLIPPTSQYTDSKGTGEKVPAFSVLGTIPTINATVGITN